MRSISLFRTAAGWRIEYICFIAYLIMGFGHASAEGWDPTNVWTTSGEVRTAPALTLDGAIIVGNSMGELFSLSPDGETNEVWLTEDVIYSAPAIGPTGTIYVGSGNKFHAFHPDGITGHIWQAGGRILMSSPAVIGSEETVYVGAEDRRLYAFNPDGTTNQVWATAGEIQSSPAVGPDGIIYVGSDDGRLYAFEPGEETPYRVWGPVGAIRSSPAIGSNGIIYAGSLDSGLYAFNPADGSTSRVWRTGGAIYSSPVIGADGAIYTGSSDNNLYAFNPNGSTNHVWNTGGAVESTPALGDDGTIYVGTVNGHFYAFNPDGTTNRTWFAENMRLSSATIGTNGLVYIGAGNGNIYAFEGTGGTLAVSPWPKFRQNIFNTGFLFSEPLNIACSDGTHEDRVAVTWDAPVALGGATGYEVWRNTSNDLNSADFIEGAPDTDYDDTSAVAGTTYYYWVRATNEAWTSRFSSPDYGHRAIVDAPVPPTNVAATAGDHFQHVLLSWDEVDAADGYEVWSHSSDDFSGASNIAEVVSTSYADSAPFFGEIRYYWIVSTNESGGSGFSKPPVSGYRDLKPPDNVSASMGTQINRIQVTWDMADGAKSYRIFRNTVEDPFTSADIGGVEGSDVFNDSGAGYGILYHYWVKSATNGYTGMVFSASASGYHGGATSHVWQVSGGAGGIAIGTNGLIYAGTAGADEYFYAFNPDGTTNHIWRLDGTPGRAPAIGNDDMIYVPGALKNRLYVLDPDAKTTNSWPTSGAVFAPPAIGSNSMVYVGSYDGKLYEFNTDGTTNRVFSNGGSEFSPAISAEGMIYSVRGSSLYAFDPAGTTAQVWNVVGGGFSAPPAIGPDGMIYAASHEGKLYAFNTDGTTSRVWSVAGTPYSISAPAFGADGTIYAGNDNGKLYAFNPNGTTNRAWTLNGPVRGAPAVGSDGTIYAGADGGKFFALNADGTTNRFWTASNAAYSPPAIGTNGFVYVSSGPAGMLCAYYGTGGKLADTVWPKSRRDNRNTSRDSSAPSVPAAPSGVLASRGTDTNAVRISWNPTPRAIGYEVFRNTSNDSASAASIGLVVSGTNYSDTTATRENLYYYWIRAQNTQGTGVYSSAVTGCLPPPPPAAVTASGGTHTNMIHVSWSQVSAHGVSVSYQVWRNSANAPETAAKLANTSGTSYNDSATSSGALYYYWIKATNSFGISEFSDSAAGHRGLDMPGGLSASKGIFSDKVQVTWSAVTGATSYAVRRGTNNVLANADKSSETTGTHFNDTSVQMQQTYYYWVRAQNPVSTGSFSGPVTGYSQATTQPDAPSNVAASKGTFTDKTVLTWSFVTNALGYQIWRGVTDSPAGAKNVATTTDTTWDDVSTEPNEIHYYWIRSTNAAGASAFSASDYGFMGALPDAPASVSATDGKYTNKVVITWASVPDSQGYEVWRNTNNVSGGARRIGTTALKTSYSDMSAVRGALYYYWVKATNISGASAFSKSDSGYSKPRYTVSDYTGDGKSDLAAFDPDSGYWLITSLQEPITEQQWGWYGAVPVPGDYDGDGKSDLAVFDDNSGYWFILSATNSIISWEFQWGWPGAEPVPGDYTGDEKSDLAVFDQNTGYWYIISLDGQLIAWAFQWGWPGAEPVPGDYTGDGKSDLAVFDQNTGYWYIISLDGQLIAWAFQWGWPGAVPVSGDYDGNGVHDPAIFDRNTGRWYITSLDGRLIAWDFRWGAKDSIPVPGDYTGDGIFDLAVFDAGTNEWHILSLDGSFIHQQSWGGPGSLPVGPGTWRLCKPDPDDPSRHPAVGSWETAIGEIFNIIADGSVTGKDSAGRSFTGTWSVSSPTVISFSIYRDTGSYKNPFRLEVISDIEGRVINADGMSAALTKILE